jgi:hypothetical protein
VHVATADSIWAFELGHRAGEIAALLEVGQVRFAPGPLPSDTPPEAAIEIPTPTVAETQQAVALAAAIGDENLRQTVQKAIGLGLAREAVDRRF